MDRNNVVFKNWYSTLVNITRETIRILDSMILPENPAIVFDIDETLIDTFLNPILPICTIYHYARLLGIKVMIVTARDNKPGNAEFIKEHLFKLGITQVERWYFRDVLDHQYASYKEQARCHIASDGHNIIMSLGDRDWDITGKHVGVAVKIPTLTTMIIRAISSEKQEDDQQQDEKLEEKLFESLFTELSWNRTTFEAF